MSSSTGSRSRRVFGAQTRYLAYVDGKLPPEAGPQGQLPITGGTAGSPSPQKSSSSPSQASLAGRVPRRARHRATIKRTFKTFYGVLREAARWLDSLLTTIPGIGPLTAASVLSEIGASVTEFFPDAAHLASWAGPCPGNHESAGKRRSGKRRHGNQHLQPVLVEAAWAAVRHDGYLKALYHRQPVAGITHRYRTVTPYR